MTNLNNHQELNNTSKGKQLIHEIFADYQERQLPILPLPRDLLAEIAIINPEMPFVFGTKNLEFLDLSNPNEWTHRLIDNAHNQHVMFGESGYGFNNNYFYFYLLQDCYFIAMKLPINNAFRDNEADLQELNQAMAWCESFIAHHAHYGFDANLADKIMISVQDDGTSGLGIIKNGQMTSFKQATNPFDDAIKLIKMQAMASYN